MNSGLYEIFQFSNSGLALGSTTPLELLHYFLLHHNLTRWGILLSICVHNEF